MSDYIVQMKAIEKSFHSNKVLHGVNFNLKKGSIHALLGENGTGKTTLMNILGGVINGDAGDVYINGNKVDVYSPGSAAGHGILFIHQELTLVNELNVYENLFLGRERKKGILIDRKVMYDTANQILNRMGVDLDPNTLVSELNASNKQVIEIARALMQNAQVIIMDEPTASLNEAEIEHIFQIMDSIKEQNVSFIFISHKLNEVMKICDDYTVMRDGSVVAAGYITSDITENDLARHMVGKSLTYDELYVPRERGDVILETKNLSRKQEFKNVNLKVHKGEIVGITGLLGDGRSELFSTIFGCNSHYDGQIYVHGKAEVMNSTVRAKELGISYLPNNRKENGIVKDLSVAQNMALAVFKQLRTFFWVDKRKELALSQKYMKDFNIKVNNLNDPITRLSGGNQQKVVLAKALASNPKLVILDNPTQGVDVGAKLEIYNIIMKLAESGVSFVVLSSEVQEILMLCDRIYVMYHGEIKTEFDRSNASEEKIMVISTGGTL
ncbi:sugar ABC transporter ATP-binding protein [Bacillus sp. V33-4]|uniref:sugar ABC transporter ATP-binding protein n=1 Tax=Bacillus sp. V33-4 TaxID=2054169 RepID=UPI000C75F573|nr:sugar ABC transporter ATP-binding protein [Bacillus sp. V33-4]PLR87130.1 ABC transporter [Bacillus sp. V33-4]